MKRNKTVKRKLLAFCLCLVLFLCTGCTQGSKSNSPYQNTDFAMGTVISQNIYGENSKDCAGQVLSLIKDLEKIISWRIEDSDIARINQSAGTGQSVTVDEKLAEWLNDCRDVYEKSGGALDVTVGPVARLWDIGGDNPRVPEDSEIQKVLPLVNGSKLKVDGQQVAFETESGKVDLGAVGKGIACDEIAKQLDEKVSGTFSVGGSVLIYGKKPDGSAWKIGVQDPRGEDGENMGVLTLSQGEKDRTFVSTSGDYEKYIEEDGVRYHHIMDPRTGYPADSGLISVTIISKSGFLSDALSTACFVAGRKEGKKLAEQYGAEAIFIDEEKQVTMTDGAKDLFTILIKEYQETDETK